MDYIPSSRRQFLAAAAACATSALYGVSHANTKQPPNLLFVFADQLRYSSCGYAGDTLAQTPAIDQLAADGANFHNAISSTPVCAAFRASLFTGKYTTSTGMVINELRLSPEHRCLGHVLTDNGYRTGYIGKWHLWANQLGHHLDPQNGFVPPGPYRLGFDGYWAAYNFNHQYYDSYYFKDTPERISPEGYEPDVQTDLALCFLDTAPREQPFALFLSYGTPHDPWADKNVPERFHERFKDIHFPNPPNYAAENDPYADDWGSFKADERDRLETWRRIYYAQTASMDWNIGCLLTRLQESGLADNTLVVFTSDHGEMFGAHGRRAKNIFYEEACRVPMVMRLPGLIPAGTRSEVCMATPDIMPTLLGLLGLPIPEAAEGLDLSGYARGGGSGAHEAALLQNTGACAAWQDGHEWRALRGNRYTYARYRRDNAEFLFDNQNDPFQQRNLIGQPEHVPAAKTLRDMLRERMEAIGDTNEASTWYRDHWTRDRVILRGARGGTHDLEQMNGILERYWGKRARKV